MAKRTQNPVTDPLEAWRQWLGESERQWNSVLNDLMGSDQFGQASGRMMEAFLSFQASMNEATQRYFSALNLPTRNDILALGEKLSAIESRLASLENSVAKSAGPSSRPSRPKPKRTKKAPAKKPAGKSA